MTKPPRVKLPAEVRERIHGHAKAFAVSAADALIETLEKQLTDAIAAAGREVSGPVLIELSKDAPPVALAAQHMQR